MPRAKKSDAVRVAEIEARSKSEERWFSLLQNPNVVRVGLLAALLASARAVRDTAGKENVGVRDICAATSAVGTLAIAADAGITDKWALGIIAGIAGVAVGQGSGGVFALGRGAWDSNALIQADPFQFSSIWSGLRD